MALNTLLSENNLLKLTKPPNDISFMKMFMFSKLITNDATSGIKTNIVKIMSDGIKKRYALFCVLEWYSSIFFIFVPLQSRKFAKLNFQISFCEYFISLKNRVSFAELSKISGFSPQSSKATFMFSKSLIKGLSCIELSSVLISNISSYISIEIKFSILLKRILATYLARISLKTLFCNT